MQFETVTTEEFKMFEKIQAYLASQLDIPADEITRDTTFESLGVDSLDTVEMVIWSWRKRSRPSASWSILSRASLTERKTARRMARLHYLGR